MTPAQSKPSTASGVTKARIIQATLTTLTREGVVGASARAIARTGDFNQALIFYHFGSVDNAIVAAVSEMGSRRVEKHQGELEQATSLLELVRIARRLHQDAETTENMSVLVQAFAGAAGKDEMGPQLYVALEPWSEMMAATLDRVIGQSPIAQISSSREIADALRALFLGIEVIDDLDSSRRHAESMFDSMEALAELLDSLFG